MSEDDDDDDDDAEVSQVARWMANVLQIVRSLSVFCVAPPRVRIQDRL